MKKFRTWYDTRIDEIEIIRETEKFVTEANGQRWAKRNPDFRNYFDTWEEARQFLIDHEQSNIAGLEKRIAHHKETLRKLQEMNRP